MTASDGQFYATLAVACFTLITATATSIRAYIAYKDYRVQKEKLKVVKQDKVKKKDK